jgi:phosphopantothenate-cysteine ligase
MKTGKILITAGGTTENIDSVRGITNHSSGKTGQTIAEKFLANGYEVFYVTTQKALKPNPNDLLHIELITNTQSLYDKLKYLCEIHEFKAIIHSMAISDYTPYATLPLEDLDVTMDLKTLSAPSDKKISSDVDYLVTFMKKTPKIISFLKDWNPKAILVGFKLLVDTDLDHLKAAAMKSIQNNRCDFVLANDLATINNEQHLAYLFHQDGSFDYLTTKEQIAEIIYKRTTEN